MRPMIRQGDVLLRPVDQPHQYHIIDRAAPVDRLVLATGEATGHDHALVGRIEAVTVREGPHVSSRVPILKLVNLLEPSRLYHPDHDPGGSEPIPAGWYQVLRQRIYWGPSGDTRTVED